MWSFPATTTERGEWRFPLAAHTAMGLYEVFTTGGVERLRDWLALDPPLALWSVSQPGSEAASGSLSTLAEWVLPRLTAALADRTAAGPAAGLTPRKRWCELVEGSLRVAAGAAWRASQEGIAPDTAYLLGLLSDAASWYGACGPSVPIGRLERGDGPLPRSLAHRLLQCRRASGGGTLARVVYAARKSERERSASDRGSKRLSQDSGPQATRPGFGSDAASYATGSKGTAGEAVDDIDSVVALWRGELHGESAGEQRKVGAAAVWGPGSEVPGECLVALAGRWQRLQELEADFSQVLQRAKLEAIGQLAYGAGHEINNPIANISSRAQTLLRDEQDPHRRHQLATINAQAFRAHEMIADLMLFARPPGMERQRVELAELIEQAAAPWREWAERQATALLVESSAGACVDVAPVPLASAIGALIRNALEALGEGGTIRLGATVDGERLEIVVEDDGPGISDEVRAHLFDPYYSGREAGRGHGLGLSKTWVIVRRHGGEIDVETPSAGGARLVIRIPTVVESNRTEACMEPADGSVSPESIGGEEG